MSTDELRDARFMQSLLAASDDCIKVLSLEGNLTFMSEGGQRTMEVSDFNAIEGCPWPDFWTGKSKADVIFALAEANAGRRSRFQGHANTAAGNPRYWDVQVSPIMGQDGRPESILSVSRDISLLKQTEDRLRLLADELKHRMKNTIALVQAIASQTLSDGHDIEHVKAAFLARLQTLSAAQDLLTQGVWDRASISEIVRTSLAPHAPITRFEISGPELDLSSKCALGLALGLHELATNANKYGALRHQDGRVRIDWAVSETTFVFNWQEHDGPPVIPPARTGFGSRIIETALGGYFNGKAQVAYDPGGVLFTLAAPVEALTAD